jgi:hypothetical protein
MADNKETKQAKPAKQNKAEDKAKQKKKEEGIDPKQDPGLAVYNALFVEKEDKEVLEKSMLIALLFIFGMLFVVFPEFAQKMMEEKKEDVVIEVPKQVIVQQPEEEKPKQEKRVREEVKERDFATIPDVKAPTQESEIWEDIPVDELEVTTEDLGDFDFDSGPTEAPGPVEIAGNIQRPVAHFPPSQPFPSKAKIMRRSGEVKVRLIVHKDGSFEIVRIEYEKPPGFGFGEACRQYLAETTFDPAMQNGRPVEVYYNLVIQFSLNR